MISHEAMMDAHALERMNMRSGRGAAIYSHRQIRSTTPPQDDLIRAPVLVITVALPAARSGGSRGLALVGRSQPVEHRFEQQDGWSVRRAGGSQRALTLSHANRRRATVTGYHNDSQLSITY